MATTTYGYLNPPPGQGYLTEPYMGASAADAGGMQVRMVVSAKTAVRSQVKMVAAAAPATGTQANMIAERRVATGAQVRQVITVQTQLGLQVYQIVTYKPLTGMQVLQIFPGASTRRGMQARFDPLKHRTLGTYLSGPYLSGPYLPAEMYALQGMQVTQVLRSEPATGMQVRQVVTVRKSTGSQVLQIVTRTKSTGMQIQPVTSLRTGVQVTQVIYNVDGLRIMTFFPSRGTADLLGDNWTSSSVATGDFYPSNLNTDVVEEVFRSAPGSASVVTLVCDTGLSQGVPIDTIAILSHNLTRSAQVQVQGSQDNFATSPRIVFNMTVEEMNMYWVAPEFPTSLGQNRYWKFIISDPTSPAGFIEIGSILFGVAQIFTSAETFTSPVTRGKRHFKDEIETEGFTSVSNNRALKSSLSLRFTALNYYSGNFKILSAMMDYARTSLKVLVIPVPKQSSRFAIFGKLRELPDYDTVYIDDGTEYIDIAFTWDESK